VRWPCFYGIDFASRAELIASGLGVEEIRAAIGADSLAYVSLEGLVAASRQPAERLCAACFTGTYPIPLPSDDLLGKHLLEGVQTELVLTEAPAAALATARDVERSAVSVHNGLQSPEDPVDLLLATPGAGDALARP